MEMAMRRAQLAQRFQRRQSRAFKFAYALLVGLRFLKSNNVALEDLLVAPQLALALLCIVLLARTVDIVNRLVVADFSLKPLQPFHKTALADDL